MPLTDVAIRNLQPRDKLFRQADGNGLTIEVQPNGSKLWRYRYRFNNKPSMISLGAYPDVRLTDARREAFSCREMLRAGQNPSRERRRQLRDQINRESTTFGQLAEEFLEKRIKEGIKPRTEKKKKTVLSLLLPDLKNQPIEDIDAALLLETLRKAERRGVPVLAQEARSVAGEVFRYAISTGRAKADPTPHLKGALTAPVTRGYAAITDIKEFRELLRAIESYSGDRLVRDGLLVLAHTFVRPGELREATWSEIDLEKKLWTIPAARMKMNREHLVPLSDQVALLFRQMHEVRACDTLVLGSRTKRNRPISDMTFNKALKSLGYGSGRHVAHGFRKTASTLLNEQGWNYDWIERQLAHVSNDKVRGIYNKALYLEGRREMMEAWSDVLKLK